MSTTLQQLGTYIGTKFDDIYKGNIIVGNSSLLNSKTDQQIISSAIFNIQDGVSTDGDTLAKLRGLITGLQSLINGDDINLDSIKEISDYIKSNKDLIDSVTTTKANKSDVYTKTETNSLLTDKIAITNIEGTLSPTNRLLVKDSIESLISSSISIKANASTTIDGYGITDSYTKTEVDSKINSMVDYYTPTGGSTDSDLTLTVSKNDYIFIDNTDNYWASIDLPTTPNIGDTIFVLDTNTSFSTNTIILDGNGNNVMGNTTYNLDTDNKEYKIIYTGSEWRVI
jgi:hypothetical protein